MKRSMFAVILAVGLAPMWAQQAPQGAPDDNGDSPDHGVARLSIVQGNVSVRHGDAGDLTAAAVNAPLVETDRVATGDQGRAEIQFDWANMIRLAPGSEVRLSQLQYKQYQVQIAAGTTMFRVLRQTDAQVEVSTPTVSLRPLQPGSYRVTVHPDGVTEITVRDGDAEIFGPKGSEALHRGQTMMARGTPDDPEFQITSPVANDEFDRWNADRDRLLQTQQTSSYRYVPPDVSGAESLDGYGQWQDDPQYGNVWVPNEGGDWAPYQDGRWSYIDYYGWSWVSGDPWGWAPYHYGNWYHSRWGWAWYPGAIGPRYYWHPAMVGFFGWGGGGFGVGFGFGNVGWVPLAPFERFHPWYGRGFAGGGRVNIVNNVNVNSVFRNARERNGVTGMRAGDFGHGAVNGATRVRASEGELARAGAVRGAMPFTASAQSRQFTSAAANTRGVPQTGTNTRFYSNRGAGGGGAAGGNRAAGGGFARQAGPGSSNGGGSNGIGSQRMNTAPANRGGGPGAGSPGGGPGVAQTRGGTGPGNAGGSGWQRLNGNNTGGGTPRAEGPRAGGPQGGGSNPGYNGAGTRGGGGAPQPAHRPTPQAPQGQGYSGTRGGGPAPQQPIRVNPPIGQSRAPSGGGGGGNASHPPSHAGGFGGGHSSGGGGGSRPSGGGGSHGGGHR
ncbi:MAG TPA: DUF6600 domain-containing protein [Bryobacteraceae bacterium]